MSSILIEPGTLEQSSAAIVVADYAGTALSIFTPDDSPIPYGVVFEVERLNVAGNYQPILTLDYGRVVLKHDVNIILITVPGTYRVFRPDISSFGVDVGAQLG